jgi:hypothetical protein
VFEDGISDNDQSRVIHGVELAAAYLDENLGGLHGLACVRSLVDPSRPAQGVTSGSYATLFFGANGWRPPQGTYPPWHLEKVAAHEFIHVWQHQFPAGTTAPVWLSEGTAEFVAYRSVIAGGVVTSAQARTFNIADATSRPQQPLKEYESVVPGQVGLSYGMISMAVGYLTESSGVDSLRAFWSTLLTKGWQAAFTAEFDTTPDDFYAAFQAKQRAGYP